MKTVGLPAWCLEILQCPASGSRIVQQGSDYVNESGKRYSFQDGILSMIDSSDISGNDADWNRFYEWFAPYYDFSERFFGKLITGVDIAEGRREIVSHLTLQKGCRLLEVSPGPGVFQKMLRAKIGENGQFVSLDLSRNMLRQCQTQDNDVILVQADAQYLPFKDNSFDAIFHFGGVNLFNNPERAINEFVRVTKSGGIVSWGDEGFSDDYESGMRKRILSSINPGYLKPRPTPPTTITDIQTFKVYDGLGYLVTAKKI